MATSPTNAQPGDSRALLAIFERLQQELRDFAEEATPADALYMIEVLQNYQAIGKPHVIGIASAFEWTASGHIDHVIINEDELQRLRLAERELERRKQNLIEMPRRWSQQGGIFARGEN